VTGWARRSPTLGYRAENGASGPEADRSLYVSGDPRQPRTTALQLGGAQRRHLRSLAHPLKPIVFVGEAGLSEALLRALDEALTQHELVKVRLRQPPDKKAAAAQLAEASGSALCGVVGHTVVLYRPHPEEPRIKLPGGG
jgi:RNA-binding protein